MFKVDSIFLNVSIKLGKIGISNFNRAFLSLKTTGKHIYELSLGFVFTCN